MTKTVQSMRSIDAISARNLVHLASSYQSDIHLHIEERSINAKSVIGILAAAIASESTVTVEANGHDATEVVEALSHFFS